MARPGRGGILREKMDQYREALEARLQEIERERISTTEAVQEFADVIRGMQQRGLTLAQVADELRAATDGDIDLKPATIGKAIGSKKPRKTSRKPAKQPARKPEPSTAPKPAENMAGLLPGGGHGGLNIADDEV